MIPIWFYLVCAFAFGSCIGSFLNVVIYRLPRDRSLAFPPSMCPGCEKSIRFYDNIPILSWLLLGGRCRNCKMLITPRYMIIELVTGLIDKDAAYVVDGNVWFDVASKSDCGKLSRRNVDELLAGTRGEVDAGKRNPADFALWKSAKPDEPWWESPWGRGRPGWHIECSAMSMKRLGESFDIHGGGLDLIFPHHENEIAQSECCHGKPMAKYWMHNGLMRAAAESGKLGGRGINAASYLIGSANDIRADF